MAVGKAASGQASQQAFAGREASQGGHMLVRIGSILDADRLAQCRQLLSQGPWVDGSVSAGALAGKAKSNSEINQHDPLAQKLGEIVVNSMMASASFQAAALPV